jgi:hypothetical protein
MIRQIRQRLDKLEAKNNQTAGVPRLPGESDFEWLTRGVEVNGLLHYLKLANKPRPPEPGLPVDDDQAA